MACGCTISDDTPLFNISGMKGVKALTRGQNKYNDTKEIMKLVEREAKRDGGWEREW